ncbi:unnamed protein product, partial [Pylaiella littoralis]
RPRAHTISNGPAPTPHNTPPIHGQTAPLEQERCQQEVKKQVESRRVKERDLRRSAEALWEDEDLATQRCRLRSAVRRENLRLGHAAAVTTLAFM